MIEHISTVSANLVDTALLYPSLQTMMVMGLQIFMNVGSNPAVGADFYPARKTGVSYGYGAGVALGSQKQSIHA